MSLADIAMGKKQPNAPQGKTYEEHVDHAATSRPESYNGVVQVGDKTVKVRGGFARVGNDVFMVSDDGRLVVDKNQHVVGIIDSGEFHQATPEIIEQLKHEGLISEQPQNPAQAAPQ